VGMIRRGVTEFKKLLDASAIPIIPAAIEDWGLASRRDNHLAQDDFERFIEEQQGSTILVT
jgi:hypothetical protein